MEEAIGALGVSPGTMGKLAAALPFVAVLLVNGLKGLWYRAAPPRWQVWLPDRTVWPALVFTFCIAGAVALRVDVGRFFPDEWPLWMPWWLSAAVAGIMLGALSWKFIYPLTVAPAAKAKAAAAVAKACGPPPFANTEYVAPVVTDVSMNDPLADTLPEPLQAPDIVTPVPAPLPSARVFIELLPGGGPDRYVLVEDEGGLQHLYPWPSG